MVNDHSDSERGNPLPPHRLLFPLTARVVLYAPSHRQDSTYHGLCYTSRGALAGTRNSSMGSPHEGSIQRPIAPWANALTTELHLAPRFKKYVHRTSVWMTIIPKSGLYPDQNHGGEGWGGGGGALHFINIKYQRVRPCKCVQCRINPWQGP